MLETTAPSAVYPAADILAYFRAQPASLVVQIAQASQCYGFGQVRESVLWL
jgi:hypothetical protein